MSATRFSVVIPTRERAETLRFALRTCLDQTFDDYEIVVSDNFSSPATRAVVDEAGSAKVRYVRTPEPLALADNWEYGVSHARGEYVILIGDDDGLLTHGLREIDRAATETGTRAIRWDAAFYTWPGVALETERNYLRVPLLTGRRVRDGHEAIRAVVEFREFYTALPMLYNAAVHRSVLDDLRRLTGRVFPHHYPDVYSGMAVAHAAGSFLSVDVPMTVSGQSRFSTGVATLFDRGRNPIDREYRELNVRAGLVPDRGVPDLPVFPEVPVADAFEFGKRVLFPDAPARLDRKSLARACVTGARVPEAEWPAALAEVRRALGDDPELESWFDAELAGAPYTPPGRVRLRPERMSPTGDALHLDAAAFGVTDVAGAALLCDRVLGYRNAAVEYGDSPHAARERLRVACEDLMKQLGAAANRIAELHAELTDAHARLAREQQWSLLRPLRALLSRTRAARR